MRRRLIVAFLAAWPLCAQASDGLAKGEVLRGRFVQLRHLVGFDAPLRTEGVFVLAQGRGLIWRAKVPFPITTVITEDGLVQDAGGTETLRLPAARMPFIAHLYDLLSAALSGDWHALAQDFAVKRTGTDAAWSLALTPRNAGGAGLPFTAIAVSGGRFVDHVRIDKADGGWEELSFTDQAVSTVPLPADDTAALSPHGP